MPQSLTRKRHQKVDRLQDAYTRATLLSYQSLLLADYLDSQTADQPSQGPSVSPTVARVLPGFVKAGTTLPKLLSSLEKQLGSRAASIDKIITERSTETFAKNPVRDDGNTRRYGNIDAGSSLRSKINGLASSPVMLQSARILQTLPPDDPGSTGIDDGPVSSGTGSDGTGTDTGSGSGDGSDTSGAGADPIPDGVGTPYQDFPPDIQQATGDLWESTAGPQLGPYFQSAVNAVQNGGDVDINGLNATLTGVVAGIAATVGGFVGAALASAALILIPRMLVAVEDALGDYLVGDLPGF